MLTMAPLLVGREHAPRALLRPEEHRVEIGATARGAIPPRCTSMARVGMRDAGIVDQDGDGAERLLGLIEGARHGGAVESRRPRWRRPCRRCLRSRPCSALSRSARRATSATAAPFAASTSAKRRPKPARRAGHQRDAALEVEQFGGFHAHPALPPIKRMRQRGRKPRHEPQHHQREELDQHERDDADIDVPRGDLRRRDAAQEEQRRPERRVHVGGLQVHRHHDAEPDRIDARHRRAARGATIGTTTKMISKASITKPSRNIASITARMAPAAPPGRSVERAMHHVVAAERRGTPG